MLFLTVLNYLATFPIMLICLVSGEVCACIRNVTKQLHARTSSVCTKCVEAVDIATNL